MPEKTPEARGWKAIDAALEKIHGEQEPLHWAPIISAMLGGPDPLQGTSAYRVADPAHWHFVTYGMSELYEKESDDPAVSGWGFEFTFRLARRGEETPPPWALDFLNNLARYVLESGNWFEPGHHLDLNGPIALGQATAIRAVAFAVDPQLGAIETPNGRLVFLQIVGLTLDELEATRAWDATKLLSLLQGESPLLLTDLARPSFLSLARVREAASDGARRDGSSQGVCYASVVEWTVGVEAAVTLGATAARELLRVLPQRLPYEKALTLAGREQALRVQPGSYAAWRADGETLVISLPKESCASFADGLADRRGTYRWPALPGLELTVVPSEIKDRAGKVVEVVG
jgi:suppressor of fused